MNRERIKSAILLFLVTLSFVLAARIWFDISIEGIFVMRSNALQKEQPEVSGYTMSKFISPGKLIINFSEGKHTLLNNDAKSSPIYSRILSDTSNILKSIFYSKDTLTFKKLSMDELSAIRNSRSVELYFYSALDSNLLAGLLDAESSPWEEISKIDSIIISPGMDALYITDRSQNAVFQFNTKNMQSSIGYMINLVEAGENFSYVFLNEIEKEKYSDKVVIPIDFISRSMPVMAAQKEFEEKEEIEKIVSSFFDEDLSAIRTMADSRGTVIYTDGQDKGVRLDQNGVLEYFRYNIRNGSVKSALGAADAFRIAAEFVNRHGGFPEDVYIAGVNPIKQGSKIVGYSMSLRYRHEGMPVIVDSSISENAIEIDVVGSEVKRYKRIIRKIINTSEAKVIKSPMDILDKLFKRANYSKGEDIKTIQDIHLAYFEYVSGGKLFMIPVWVVEAEAYENPSDPEKVKKYQYIFSAESGLILDIR